MLAITRILREATRKRLEPLGLEPGHIGVLALLSGDDGKSQRELGRELRTDRTTMVRLLDELEKVGLVSRQSGEDRRVNSINLTAAGHRIAKDMDRAVRSAQSEVFAGLPENERRKLIAALGKVYDSLPQTQE